MRRLRDQLPPANSLVVFEAAARHLSFTLAAKELQVSQAAVSRQIQVLEDYLGEDLFVRHHRAISLTAAGDHFSKAVSVGLVHIAGAVGEIRAARHSSDVTIASSVTFASYWLMSRIAQYRAEFSDIDVRLVASANIRSPGATDVDLAVRYGRGNWPGTVSRHLFDNDIFPVCAPAYLDRHGPLESFADLANATLLHLDQFDRNWVTWETWFREFDFHGPIAGRRLSFDNYTILIHAAVAGEGVALCGGRLAEDLIAQGELVRPVRAAVRSDFAFYLTHPDSRPLRPAARKLHDWLIDQSRTQRETSSPADQIRMTDR